MFKNWLGCVAVVFLCAGCPSPGPGRFGNPGDGGGDIGPTPMPDIASGGDDGGGAGDVTGTAATTFIADSGPVARPVDLAKVTIAARFQVGQAWNTIAGTGRADGTFTIPNVPQGTYYLRYGT